MTIVKSKDIKRERANANETLKNIETYINMKRGKIDSGTRALLIEDAEGAFNLIFACAKAEGLPIGSTTPRRAAEQYIIGCINMTLDYKSPSMLYSGLPTFP